MNEVNMANNQEINIESCTINDLCRLCANYDANSIPIYTDEGADHMLENKIKTHLPFLNICENDLLPKRLCYHCASTVLVWTELYKCSSHADQKLRNMFEPNQFDQNQCKVIQEDDRLNPTLKSIFHVDRELGLRVRLFNGQEMSCGQVPTEAMPVLQVQKMPTGGHGYTVDTHRLSEKSRGRIASQPKPRPPV